MREESGFTLVEILISVTILGILIASVGGALVISLKATDVTKQRLAQSNDVQIASAYLANDVQSASDVHAPSDTANCSGAFTTLVTLTYSSSGHPNAVYKCGTAPNGETQITRTFNGGTPIVLAHLAGAARPNVVVAYDPAHPSAPPVSVTITLTKASDCTLDCTYTLFGYRRSFDPTGGVATGGPPTGDVVLLSTGASSPLWVQGSCPSPGTIAGCIVDPAKTALPIADVTGFTTGWSATPLWSKLNDAEAIPPTFITSAAGSTSEARVLLSAVNPPDPGVLPTFEFHVSASSGTGSTRVTLSVYNGSTLLAQQTNVGPINQPKSYDWTLSAAQTAAIIPTSAYDHLTLGIAVASARPSNAQSISVDGVAFDTLDVTAVGLLTIKGPLYVNSPLSTAVRLTGQKNAMKISILSSGDPSKKWDFQILNPGACSGCNHNTVGCPDCAWVGDRPWTSYSQSIPDPLRALPPPNPATLGSGTCNGSGACTPGVYSTTFSRTSNTTLSPGIYYFSQGMSISGSASLTCPAPCTGGVMIYIAAGSVSFTGTSSVNLPGLSGKVFANGLYDGLVMFQARTDTAELKFAGNSGSGTPNALSGIVYVPQSNMVTLATGTASFAAKAIVAQNVKVSSAATIG
jgi:prepilin-type N-terminal cleavage/methylation domain-containing protein